MKNCTRRQTLLFGLGAVSTLVLGAHDAAIAAVGDAAKVADGVTLKTLGEGKSMIPGYSKVQLREMTFQPGAVFAIHPMTNAMVCHLREGELLIDQGAGEFIVKQGTIWTCMAGGKEGAKNTGKTVAVMSISDLLT